MVSETAADTSPTSPPRVPSRACASVSDLERRGVWSVWVFAAWTLGPEAGGGSRGRVLSAQSQGSAGGCDRGRAESGSPAHLQSRGWDAQAWPRNRGLGDARYTPQAATSPPGGAGWWPQKTRLPQNRDCALVWRRVSAGALTGFEVTLPGMIWVAPTPNDRCPQRRQKRDLTHGSGRVETEAKPGRCGRKLRTLEPPGAGGGKTEPPPPRPSPPASESPPPWFRLLASRTSREYALLL